MATSMWVERRTGPGSEGGAPCAVCAAVVEGVGAPNVCVSVESAGRSRASAFLCVRCWRELARAFRDSAAVADIEADLLRGVRPPAGAGGPVLPVAVQGFRSVVEARAARERFGARAPAVEVEPLRWWVVEGAEGHGWWATDTDARRVLATGRSDRQVFDKAGRRVFEVTL